MSYQSPTTNNQQPTARYQIGDSFPVQFVWQLPNGDFLRDLFQAQVLAIDWGMEKYTLQLIEWLGGRQESSTGESRSIEQVTQEYWMAAKQLVGKKFTLAFEAEDGKPVRLKLTTLTGEHRYFNRNER